MASIIESKVAMLVKVESLTKPHVLAGPGHVVVEGEVIVQPSLYPLTGAAPLLLALKTGVNINGMYRQASILWIFLSSVYITIIGTSIRCDVWHCDSLDKKYTSISIIRGTLEVSIFPSTTLLTSKYLTLLGSWFLVLGISCIHCLSVTLSLSRSIFAWLAVNLLQDYSEYVVILTSQSGCQQKRSRPIRLKISESWPITDCLARSENLVWCRVNGRNNQGF